MKNNIVFAAGFSSAAIQILFLREYLSVFSGNEMTIGLIFAFWLLFGALGSILSRLSDKPRQNTLNFLYIISVIIGFILIRAVRLLFEPGELIPPWAIPLIIVVSQSDAAFFGGLVYGRYSQSRDGSKLYALENIGALVGLIILSIGIFLFWPNGIIVAVILSLFTIYNLLWERTLRSLLLGTLSFAIIIGFLLIDPLTLQWKYPSHVDAIEFGYSGEIAKKATGEDTLIFINNMLYKNKIQIPSIEQSVHLPVSMHNGNVRKALVIGNNGYTQELEKYKNIDITCIENEPLLAKKNGCRYQALENMAHNTTFDVIILGSSMPITMQTCRFFTKEYFKKMKLLAGESGILSFTLPLSDQMLSPDELLLKNNIVRTLRSVFPYTKVIPGAGYTFCGSAAPLLWPIRINVTTRFLENYTLASLKEDRIIRANEVSATSMTINRINHPIALYFAQKQWLGIFGTPVSHLIFLFIIIFIAAFFIFPKSANALSIGSTGLIVGVYTIAVMFLFQFSHGTLYAQCSLLMIALAIGFAAGSFVKKFPFSNLVIGSYACLSLLGLSWVDAPITLFLLVNTGMGFIAAAQFSSRKSPIWNELYSADLLGGVIGMLIGSTILIPFLGIPFAALGIGIAKLFIGLKAEQ